MDAPRIDFYLLAESGPGLDSGPDSGARDAAACRIAETAWRRGHRVHLHTGSEEAARRLDDLLWTWRDESFVPHALSGPEEAPENVAVTLGWGALPGFADDVLVNLDPAVPAGFERFARVLEVVGGGDPARAAGRERFRHYRGHGCEPLTHRL